MILSGSFYTVTRIETLAPQHYRILLTLVPEHRIYAGHFPGNPVVPGVCSLHMVTECAGMALGYPVLLHQASSVKFLGVVHPAHDRDLEIDMLADSEMTVKAAIISGKRTVMSCKLKFRKNQ